jgi:iron(III) transport system substrate-binding protein
MNDEFRMTNKCASVISSLVMRHSSLLRYSGFVILAFAPLVFAHFGCSDRSSNSLQPELMLYTSVDEPVLRPIIAAFESRTGIKVVVQTDTEANKSAGLAAKLEAERDNSRADVWWGNEVFHTIRLADAGVLDPYESPSAKDIPAKFKDAAHRWAGNGLRARVIAIPGSTLKVVSLDDLVRSEHRGKVAIARPTAGTTGSHVAALYTLWGPDRFKEFFMRLQENEVKLLGGNMPVAEAVGRGEINIGLTDNDDVAVVQANGGSITSTLPDQDTIGTLAIPTTPALVKGSRNTEAAKKLVDYLLSQEVEQKLLDAKFAGYSVRAEAKGIRTMDVDFHAVAKALPVAVETAMTILEQRQ